MNIYFSNDYDKDVKSVLLSYLKNDLVEIKRPEQFNDIDEDDFIKFIKKYDVPTEIIYKNSKDEHLFIDLIMKLLSKYDGNEELARSIDYVIFERFWKKNENSSHRSELELGESLVPVQLLNESWLHRSKEQILFYQDKQDEDMPEDILEYFAASKYYIKGRPDEDYLKLANFEGFLTFFNSNYFEFEGYCFSFALLKYAIGNIVDINGYNNILRLMIQDYNRTKNKANLKIIIDILGDKKYNFGEDKPKFQLDEKALIDHSNIINDVYNLVSIECKEIKDGGDVIEEVIDSIKEELKFNEMAETINWRVLKVGRLKQDKIGYTRLNDSEVYLFGVRDIRKYRECIKSYLKEIYSINLDTKNYNMTAIDSTMAKSIDRIDLNDYKIIINENIWYKWKNSDVETKKRLLMEPYHLGSKIIPGYGRTCPFCEKKIVTELSTMRIKSIIADNKYKYEFLCCSTCADLFYYSEAKFVRGIEELSNAIDSEIEIEFFISPEYIDKPYKIRFVPRLVHRYLLEMAKNKET